MNVLAHPSLLAAAVSGLVVVICGAFGAHGLEGRLDAYRFGLWQKAVLWQMLHTGALLGVGILQVLWPHRSLAPAGWSFGVGMGLFCGTLYLMALGGPAWLGAVTPLGGVAFLAGWCWLALVCSRP